MRMLFTREVQKSLASSSKQLVEDVVTDLGYRAFFDILRDEVRSKPNGSKFEFSGLNDIVVGDLKSYEGVDIAVICEAENLTRNTFENFNQTIRKPGSEIWIVFNPQYEDDFVCDLCINNPPKNMISLQVNGYALAPDNKTVIKADNPFITDTMIGEAQRLHDTDLALFEKDCLGIPRGEGGRIYPMYNKDLHEVNFPLSELSKCDLYMSIDPTPKYYPAILWLAVTPTDSVIIYNEYPKFDDLNMFYDDARKTVLFDDKSMKDLANIILANDFDHLHGQRITRTGDPRFFSNDVNYVPALMSHGVHGWVDAPFDKIETHRETIKSFINYNPALPVCGANMPELYVATGDRTKNIRRALERHCWEDKKDEESERFKDFIDALRYFFGIVDGRPRFKQRTTKKHETRIISSRAAVMGGINSDWGDE
jgi:PBSX family phage terminase large subunit